MILNIRSGTRIDGGFISSSSNYGYFNLSQTLSGNINANTVNAMTITSHGTLTDANFAYISKASWEASGGRDGTPETYRSLLVLQTQLLTKLT